MSDTQGPQIGIARIYTKDLSFESPSAPKIFTIDWRPEVKLDVSVRPQNLEGNFWEVTLKLTAEARHESTVGFIVEVEQAGIFELRGMDKANTNRALHTFCPSTLFPYARQVIDQSLIQGGFAPLMLAPLNFEQLQKQAGSQPQDKRTDLPTQ